MSTTTRPKLRPRMTPARRLFRFRAALAVFAATTIPFVFIALPTIHQAANIQNLSDGWMPTPQRLVVAVILLVVWSGSGIAAMSIEEKRLYANRRRAARRRAAGYGTAAVGRTL